MVEHRDVVATVQPVVANECEEQEIAQDQGNGPKVSDAYNPVSQGGSVLLRLAKRCLEVNGRTHNLQ